jgi:hypothetical protein
MVASSRRVAIALASLVALTAMASCRSATEVVVEVRTNAAYRDGLVVSFTVGTPGEVESAEPTTEQRGPWGTDGFVGSLAVVPRSGSSKDTALGVKIVMGVDRDARSCAPPDYRGCIVSRRRLHYTPHERLVLPIALYVECKDVPCGVDTTCNALGQCVDAALDPVTCTAGSGGCSLPGEVGPGGTLDGGEVFVDALAPADGANDGPPTDANVDGPSEAGSDGGAAGKIECGSSVCDATSGERCCFDGVNHVGSCAGVDQLCPANSQHYTFACDGSEDCPQLCCVVGGGSTVCAASCGSSPEVCQSTHTCSAGTCTIVVASGYYRACQ